MAKRSIFCFIVSLLSSFSAKTTSATKESWDYLKMAQFWPGTSCVYFGEKKCAVPPSTHSWTIHGLWPSAYTGELPAYCNDSMTFNYTEIKVLRHQLNEQWPNFNKSGSPLALWSHEWTKHGTCAYELPVLQGELKYFNSTLQLHNTLDLLGVLSGSRINPSKKKFYDLTDIFLAVSGKYSKVPQIKCLHMNDTYYLEEIWLCYDKTFNLIDCPEASPPTKENTLRVKYPEKPELPLYFKSEKKSYFVDCPSSGGVLYVPIPRSQKSTP
ncbi:unnamed protein product [Candidula unifasciata]|uniref:Uncharacterized protein n=1 Tax=Candidula unifasciata TaxID=100452 RepID=A0A8S3Z7U7_9EUPU|nr:unnamed protein product [Candidula unifasciata]